MLVVIVPQDPKSGEPMEGCLTTIVEEAGLDFFTDLPDDVEDRLEGETAERVW